MVLDQSPDALIFADRAGLIRVWNARAEALFGYTAGEATGKSLDLIIPERLRAAHWSSYQRAIETGRTRLSGKPMRTRGTRKDGSKIYVDLAFSIVSHPSLGVLGAVATGRESAEKQDPGSRP